MIIDLIVGLCIVVFLLWKIEKHVNLHKQQPDNGYQLINLILSGKIKSLKKVNDHLFKIAQQSRYGCTMEEAFVSAHATLGLILSTITFKEQSSRGQSSLEWKNATIYLTLYMNLDSAKKVLDDDNLDKYKEFYEDIASFLLRINGNKLLRQHFLYYAEHVLELYLNPHKEKLEKKIFDKLNGESIGTLIMGALKAASDDIKEMSKYR